MAKTERLYIRLTPELKEQIQAAAEAEGRSISNYVEHLITQAGGLIALLFSHLGWHFLTMPLRGTRVSRLRCLQSPCVPLRYNGSCQTGTSCHPE